MIATLRISSAAIILKLYVIFKILRVITKRKWRYARLLIILNIFIPSVWIHMLKHYDLSWRNVHNILQTVYSNNWWWIDTKRVEGKKFWFHKKVDFCFKKKKELVCFQWISGICSFLIINRTVTITSEIFWKLY